MFNIWITFIRTLTVAYLWAIMSPTGAYKFNKITEESQRKLLIH